MARFLVTGGAGFIGSHLVERLLKEGHVVRVLDDLSTGRRENLPHTVEFIYGDITNPAAVERAFDGVEACFHLAAIASVIPSGRGWLRTHQVNLTGTINILEQARCSRNSRAVPVIYASSAAVYGESDAVPINEQHRVMPVSAYGADKYGCELHARVAGCVHGIPTVGLRFFNLYGRRQNPQSPYSGVVTIFADRLARSEPVEIFGDGQQVRDFTYVGDAISALCRALPAASIEAPVFNVCTGKGTTVDALARTMATLYRADAAVIYRPPRPSEVRVSIGDPTLAARKLGFTAKTSLTAGLVKTLDLPIPLTSGYG
jgi:UDP-glucose 4-epimerase